MSLLSAVLCASLCLTVEVNADDDTTARRSADQEARTPEREPSLETARPTKWLPEGRRCRRRRGRTTCDGPRRVPEPHGAAARLAEELGIGTHRTAIRLLVAPPEPEWVDAVRGEPTQEYEWPVDGGSLWRGFGRIRQRAAVRHRLHKGIDIGAPDGTPIRSVADGLVVYSNNELSGYGNMLMIVHADGATTFYAHCQAIYVFPGQQVRKGQLVAEVGHTGLARGPHLHFELRMNGRAHNPIRRFPAEFRPPRYR